MIPTCPISDLVTEQCAHCTGATLPPDWIEEYRVLDLAVHRLLRVIRWEETRTEHSTLPTYCTNCGDRIDAGPQFVTREGIVCDGCLR